LCEFCIKVGSVKVVNPIIENHIHPAKAILDPKGTVPKFVIKLRPWANGQYTYFCCRR
jgi:hypothetical protein